VTRLHRIQNSVWAGEMTRIDWQDLDRALREHAGSARVQAWLFQAPPQVHRYGDQDDQESIFV
jgi:hypothetical protein